VVKPPTLQTEIKFYHLKKDNELVYTPTYNDRCLTGPGRDSVLPETEHSNWFRPKTTAEKLTKAALKILDVVFWNWKGLPAERCGEMMSRTVSIAMTENKDLFIAGNLNEGFQLDSNQNQHKILNILTEDLGSGAFKNVWVINDQKQTFGKKGRSHSHAEMQIARYAYEKNLKIEHLGVSKTPCCACNTVLRKAKYSDGTEVKAPHGDENNDPYHVMFANIANIASARGTDQYTDIEDQMPHWVGGIQFQLFQGNTIFPDWVKYWRHPSQVDFIPVEAKKIQ